MAEAGKHRQYDSGKLEMLLSKMAGEPIEVCGSGRTDAGVHAMGQVANFHSSVSMEPEEIMDYMNFYLPEDIAVISLEEAPQRFHSRLNAVGKTYCYRVLNTKIPHVFERRYVHVTQERLDLPAMERAAGYLLGIHDFKAFTSNKRSKNQRSAGWMKSGLSGWKMKYASGTAGTVFCTTW